MIIYLHRNTVNGKVYIGQTKTTLTQRSRHDGSGYKNCSLFWNAIEKYGWDKFSHTILEKCTENNVDEREQYWINFFDATNPNFGYNLMPGGRAAKDKSLVKIGVYCKETGQYFTSLSDAAEWAGLARTSMHDITRQIEGERISAGKHPDTKIPLHWCFSKEEINIPNKIRSSHNAMAVILLETGEIFQSIRKAAESTALCQTTISKNCKSKGTISIHKADKNYTWMYLTDYLNCQERRNYESFKRRN